MDSDRSQAQPAGSSAPQLRIELGGAGWVLILAALLGLLLLWMLTWPILSGQHRALPLDPDPEQSGLDLSTCLIPRSQIVRAAALGSIPPLNGPRLEQGQKAAAITREFRRKYHHKFVVEGDRVVGVSLHGESRAYQLKLLQWHEVANDELGGVPIAVTYSPLTDSVAVYDRRVEGQLLALAASGMLYNSNSLLTDYMPGQEPLRMAADPAHEEGLSQQESRTASSYPPASWPGETFLASSGLWSQLDGRALTGSFAARGARLRLLPCELTHWGDWLARHPDTTLLSHETGYNRKYTLNAYGAYFDRMKLRFPVDPPPSGSVHEQFARMVAVQQPDGEWQVWDYATLRAEPQQAGLRFVYEPWAAGMEPDSVRLAEPGGLPVVYGLRFAFEAFGMLDPAQAARH